MRLSPISSVADLALPGPSRDEEGDPEESLSAGSLHDPGSTTIPGSLSILS